MQSQQAPQGAQPQALMNYLSQGQSPAASQSANGTVGASGLDNGQTPAPMNQQGVVAQNAAIQDPGGNTDLSTAGGQLDGHDWSGLCEKYAEQMTYGHSNMYPSAVAAWNSNVTNGNATAGTAGIKTGDLVYFAGDNTNGGYGHAGIYEGNGNFKSATYNGVQTNNLNTWIQNTGQKLLGYVPPHKGK